MLHMQPIFKLRTGQVARWEALVRMPGPDGTLLPPASFLPIAERFGLARDVDRWVLARAVELVRDYERRGERGGGGQRVLGAGSPTRSCPIAGALFGKTGVDPAAWCSRSRSARRSATWRAPSG